MLERIDIEESNAKCQICSSGLTYVEHALYGNRCVFCVSNKYDWRLFNFLVSCYYDLKIYRQLLRLSAEENGRIFPLGALGMMGYTDINMINTIKKKRELLKILRGMK